MLLQKPKVNLNQPIYSLQSYIPPTASGFSSEDRTYVMLVSHCQGTPPSCQGLVPRQPAGGFHRSAVTGDIWRSCYGQHIHQINYCLAWGDKKQLNAVPEQMLPPNRQTPGCFLHYRVNVSVAFRAVKARRSSTLVTFPSCHAWRDRGWPEWDAFLGCWAPVKECGLWTFRNWHRESWLWPFSMFSQCKKEWTRCGSVPLKDNKSCLLVSTPSVFSFAHTDTIGHSLLPFFFFSTHIRNWTGPQHWTSKIISTCCAPSF